MLTFLSDEWLAALHEAVADDAGLAEATADLDLTIEQHVTADPEAGPEEGDVIYHVSFSKGRCAVVPGPASAPTVRFTQDRATAAAIASGAGSAQRAFMTGRLRVGGDLQVLLEHRDTLAQLDDLFASVRARTSHA